MSCIKFADLFCGAGGTTVGAELTGSARCQFAVNHWDVAIDTHEANHPHAEHRRKAIADVGPGECPAINLLFASPSCTHHSRARGGRPTSDQQRSGAWEVMPWIDHHRPSFMVIENVPEFREWGPVGRDGIPLKSGKGRLFNAWIKAVEGHGYRTEVGILNAADFGAATSRKRLFVIARKGQRAAPFPEPSHARGSGQRLPGMGLAPWRTAAEVIDWSLPCPSLFVRGRPLADNTLSRIEAGLRRYVGPFVAQWDNTGFGGKGTRGADEPVPTIVTKANAGVVVPFQYQLIGNGAGRSRGIDRELPTIVAARENHGVVVPFISPNFGEREGQLGRFHSLELPAPTITGHGAGGVVVPFVATVNHGDSSRCGRRPECVNESLGAVTGKNGRALVVPFLSQYYGTGEGSEIKAPVPTIVTKDRHSLVLATISPSCASWPEPHSPAMQSLQEAMRSLGVGDIGFRMLQNHELAAAQGFPADYKFSGNKSEITKQVGNSVSPPVAKAITATLLGC